MSERFSERRFLNRIIISLLCLGLSLIIGFIIIFLVEYESTLMLLELLFAGIVGELVNPVVVFILGISLYTVAGPGIVIWLINTDPDLYFNILGGVLLSSLVTWLIIGLLIGYITKNNLKAAFQGLLTINICLVFTIIMEIVLMADTGLLFTGWAGLIVLAGVMLLTVTFSLISIVYCTIMAIIGGYIFERFSKP